MLQGSLVGSTFHVVLLLLLSSLLMFVPSPRRKVHPVRLRLPLGALFASMLVVPTVVVVAPTVTAVRSEPRPVAPSLSTVPLAGVDASALRTAQVPTQLSRAVAARQAPAVLTAQLPTDDYQMAAVTWDPVRRPADVLVSLRYRTGAGWSDWVDLGGTDPDAQASGPEAKGVLRQGTVPYFTGPADGVQVRVDQADPTSPLPDGLRIDLIDPGTSAADAQVAAADPASSAVAGSRNPDIITRAEWGADESLRAKHLDMSRTVKVAYVHHTVGTSSYSPSQGPAQVRSLYAYYVNSLGYSDMGYNFLVDKYGRIYEGRAGSITTSVRQAATGGFNPDTMAVAAMGNFMDIPASDAMVTSIGRLLGFRLASYHRNPLGKRTLVAEDGSSRYSAGEKAVFRVISGHRDAGFTACPGNHLYLRIPRIRKVAKHWMGANLVEPRVSGAVVPYGTNASVRVQSGVLQQQRWELTITQGCTQRVVRRYTGTAAPGDPIAVRWRGVDADGRAVPAGQYVLRLTSENDASRSVPWVGHAYLQVGAPPAAPAKGPGAGRASAPAGQFVPLDPTRLANSATGAGLAAPLMLGRGDRVDIPVLGRAGVPDTGVTAVALSVQASCVSRSTALSVFPAGTGGPGGAVVQVAPGQVRRGTAVVGVGTGGAVSVVNRVGAASFSVDVTGYWTTTGGTQYAPVPPRSVLGARGGVVLDPGGTTFTVAGRAGVPADARAVVLNVRQRADTRATALSLRGAGAGARRSVQVTAVPGRANASRVVVPVGAGGAVRIGGNGSARVSVDVAGYFGPAAGAEYHAVAPRRLTADRQRLGRDDFVSVTVGGRAGVPSTGVDAVVLQVTGSRARAGTAVTVTPSGTPRYGVADLLVPRRTSRTNLVVVPVGRHHAVRVHNASGRLGVQVDVVGWFG
jgi:hypothetical protein